MGFDVKEIQVCVRRVLNFFVTSSCRFVKKYPVVSGILLFFFLLNMFLPSVLTFLVFSLPILIFIAVAFRLIFRIHRQNLKSAKGEKGNYGIFSQEPSFVGDDPIVDKRENPSLRQSLSVRRRNAKEKQKQVYVQERLEEKDMVVSTMSDDALVDKTALIEENPKEIREVKVDSFIDHTKSSSAASQLLRPECSDASEGRSNNGGGGELEAESSEDTEDEDEEETQEDGNKAVEWTDADQKNLTDLGLSEVERNKRLESLIVKRRARKLLSMQVRRTTMNLGKNDPRGQIASISIPRGNPFPPNSSCEGQVSPTPLSAPSILLPMHDPFDLPYEPQEERPNLTGGSFQEEFLAPHLKDMMFCRHESFSLGPFFPGPGEFDQCRRESYCHNFATRQRAPEIPEYYRLRHQSGKEDTSQLIQTDSFQEDKPMLHINSSYDHARQHSQASEQVLNLVDIHHEEDRSEVHTQPNLVSDVTAGSSSSSSSELNVPFSAANKDEILKSLSFSVPKNITVDRDNNVQRNELLYDCGPSSFGKKRPEARFFYADKGVHHTPTHSIASDLQVEVSEVSSPALTVDGTISPSDGESLTYDGDGDVDVQKETTFGHDETWVASSNLSRVEENESRSMEVHEVSEQDIMEVGFSRINQKYEDPIESCMLPEKVVELDSIDSSVSSSKTELPESRQTHSADFIGEVHDKVQPATTYSSEALSTANLTSSTHAQQSTKESEANLSYNSNSQKPEEQPSYSLENYDMNDQVFFANDDKDIMEFIKSTYGEARILVKQETPGDISVPAMENGAKSVEIVEGNHVDPENDHLKSTSEREFQKQSENKHTAKGSKGLLDIGPSGANQNSDDPMASVMQPEIVAELGPTNSSSSSSPTSTTEEKARQFGADMVDYNFLPEPLPESSNLTVSEDGLHLTEGSVTYLSNDRDPEKSWEPYIPLEKSTRELDIIYNVNDPEISVHHDMENLNIIKDNDIEETISKPIISNEGQYDQQGEHQTLESYKPFEEPDNSRSPEDFEAELEKPTKQMDVAAPSSPIEKTDTWESSQDRECEQVVIDVGFSGVGQRFGDPIPSAMLPELVVEQFPNAFSSCSSPKCETQEMVSVSRPIEKTDTWESSQDRECEQVVIDVGFSGATQSFSDPILSAMLPELMVEQVPIALSSSSSPKSDTRKMVSVDPASSNIDSEMHLKVQKFDEDMVENKLLDKVLPENLTPTAPQNAVHLMLDSTTYQSRDEDLEELQEPSNPSMLFWEMNSSYSMKDSEVPANDDMKNLETIDDINSEAHILIKEENGGILSKMSEESRSTSIDTEYMEGQSGKMNENQTVLESYKPIEKNNNLNILEDFEGDYLNLADCNNIAETSNPVGNNDILESTQEHEQETVEVGISEVSPSTDGANTPLMLPGIAEGGLSGLNQSFINDPNPPAVLPEVVVEQVSIASSSSSSPTSVLQKFSIDHASASSFDQEILMDVQQSETETEENNMLNGFPPENLTATAPQNALHLMEDSTAHPSNSRDSENLQEASNSPGKSTEENSRTGNINSTPSNEKEEN